MLPPTPDVEPFGGLAFAPNPSSHTGRTAGDKGRERPNDLYQIANTYFSDWFH